MATRRNSSSKDFYEEHKYYIVPSLIGGAIAWFFSGSLSIGIWVFIAVWIGNWVGNKLLGK